METVEIDKQEEMDRGDKSTASFCHVIGSDSVKKLITRDLMCNSKEKYLTRFVDKENYYETMNNLVHLHFLLAWINI